MAKKTKQQREAFPTDESAGSDSPSFIRIKVPLNQDGSPDLSQWDARDSTKERYRALVSHPEFLRKIGVGTAGLGTADGSTPMSSTPGAPAVTGELFPPEQLLFAFDIYAGICAFAFSVILKSDFDTCYENMKFTEEQKELMAKPLSILVTMYTPAEYAMYAPHIQLGTMLVGFTAMGFSRTKAAIAEQRNRPSVVRPIEKPADPKAPYSPLPEREEAHGAS